MDGAPMNLLKVSTCISVAAWAAIAFIAAPMPNPRWALLCAVFFTYDVGYHIALSREMRKEYEAIYDHLFETAKNLIERAK